MMTTTTIFLCILGFFLGSIPFGLIFTRLFFFIDLRKTGSGNIGATNARRAGGWKLGLATLAGDILKGAGPVLVAAVMAKNATPALKDTVMGLTAIAAVFGHMFPVFLKFRPSGKGVATAAGGFAVISPVALGAAIALFVSALILFRRVSAGSLAAAATLPVFVFFFTHSGIFTGGALVISLAIIFRHRDNIRRLMDGTEPKIGRQMDD